MPPSHHGRGGKEEPKNFEIEVIMDALWWRGEPKTTCLFVFVHLVAEDARFQA